MAEHNRGPGYRRMHKRLGPEQAEALRQQVLREQEQALSDAGKHRPINERERQSYSDYPTPSKPKEK